MPVRNVSEGLKYPVIVHGVCCVIIAVLMAYTLYSVKTIEKYIVALYCVSNL
jgi:hypothetical protein